MSGSAPDSVAAEPPRWYLGFDAATRTFAWSLSRIDRAGAAGCRRRYAAAAELLARARSAAAGGDPAAAAVAVAAATAAITALKRDTTALIVIADGATADLVPGRPDADVSTVERIRAMAAYLRQRVRPAVALARKDDPPPTAATPLRVLVEFQMGPNAASRTIAAALVALFAEDDVFIVGPVNKNRVALGDRGHYGLFAEAVQTAYTANKNHAKFNFAEAERLFISRVPPSPSRALRGHIADSFMQVLGHIQFGSDEDADKKF